MVNGLGTAALSPEDAGDGRVTVRDATFAVMRQLGMTTIFGNPGSTEVPFLTDLPDSIRYVLALHEGAVVGIATGYALATETPAFVNLHGSPGLGNAVNGLANARDSRAPLVVVVGQQDRRHLAVGPFLAGRDLERLAGDYAVWTSLPVRAEDVPGAIARAYHEAQGARGPALVVVPMGDWSQPADPLAASVPAAVVRPRAVAGEELASLADLVQAAAAPALLVGAGAASPAGWDAVTELAEQLGCPVWQEPFAARAGFPPEHPQFVGDLPWMRRRVRQALAPHDLVLAVGTSAFRGYIFDEPVALTEPGTVVAVVTEDPAEAYRSPCDLAVVAPVAETCAALAKRLPARAVPASAPARAAAASAPEPPAPDEPLRPGHVFAELARRLPADTVLVEETPSSRPELLTRLPARNPLGLLSNGGGQLGFGLSGGIGLKLALPDRPVVAILGDGSAMYTIQALWSAARYRTGVLLIVMKNGGYAVMDALAEARGGTGAWPGFDLDVAGMARCFGCPSVTVGSHAELVGLLDDVVPGLRDRREPLLVQVDLEQPEQPK